MHLSFIKSAFRNIKNDKVYSIINISGLAIGLTCVILIFLWIKDEVGYDRFHKNLDNLYLVQQSFIGQDGLISRGGSTPWAIADAFREEVPEIIQASQFGWLGRRKIEYNNYKGFEGRSIAVSTEFLTMFSFKFLQGDPQTALDDPYSMVVTEEFAKKVFGDENPVGKNILVEDKYSFKISALIKDLPKNSTIQFRCLVPVEFSKIIDKWNDQWGSNSINTYVLLANNVNVAFVNEKITVLRQEHLRLENSDEDDKSNSITRCGYALAPLKKLHLYSFGDNVGLDNIHYVYIFSSIALFILIIASINFVNLSIARSLKRARDIGIRKVTGAKRGEIAAQFLGESLIYTLIAVCIGLFLVYILLPQFNTLTQKHITIHFLKDSVFILSIIGIILITVILSGCYPAFFLSAYKPVDTLKGKWGVSNTNGFLKHGLIVFQFTISLVLIILTLLGNRQIQYMKKKDIGFDKEQLMFIVANSTIKKHYNTLKKELKKCPGIKSVSGCSHLPVQINSSTDGFRWEGMDRTKDFVIWVTNIDYDYYKTLNLPLTEGRPYSPDFASDSVEGFIINETARKEMGVASAEGLRVDMWDYKGKIVGVTKDFHFQPLRTKIRPLVMILRPEMCRNLIVGIYPGQIEETRKNIKEIWNKIVPGVPIQCNFFDKRMQNFYRQEERTGKFLFYFSVMAILIACLGLFGLSSFMIQNRTKEIGVRKVNGAKITRILFMLNKDFLKNVGIAYIIACPIAYLAMHNWLQNFAYRTTISWWVFVLAGIMATFIAIATISWQTIRTARRNPVEALRYE